MGQKCVVQGVGGIHQRRFVRTLLALLQSGRQRRAPGVFHPVSQRPASQGSQNDGSRPPHHPYNPTISQFAHCGPVPAGEPAGGLASP